MGSVQNRDISPVHERSQFVSCRPVSLFYSGFNRFRMLRLGRKCYGWEVTCYAWEVQQTLDSIDLLRRYD
jgi:hypothetical protein